MKYQFVLASLFSVLHIGCTAYDVKRTSAPPDSFPFHQQLQYGDARHTPFLKAHMKNGNLYVFDAWAHHESRSTVEGDASLYSPLRERLGTFRVTIGFDSVALFETNVLKASGPATAFTIFTGITAAVAVLCAISPKTCFGSCPTFYVSDGDSIRLQAEGFSASIAPSLEATDIDALYHLNPDAGILAVDMKNEALETHVVRSVNVLAVPRHANSRVFRTNDNSFWAVQNINPPRSAVASEGNCLQQLNALDGNERISLADSSYLGAKEFIDLEFDFQPDESYGLVIGSRQSLMSTYLLYQALAYMGNEAGYWLAEVERGQIGDKGKGLQALIGGIAVLVENADGSWRLVDSVEEQGPLATDLHVVPLGNLHSPRVRLRLTQGAWRIDYCAIAKLDSPSEPVRLRPALVQNAGQDDEEALRNLRNPERSLVTFPGDAYTLLYALPENAAAYEYFLESRGYYLEWIRKEWIEEENQLLLAQMFLAPDQALRRMASEFKAIEPRMEELFWRSRYAKP